MYEEDEDDDIGIHKRITETLDAAEEKRICKGLTAMERRLYSTLSDALSLIEDLKPELGW